MRFISVDLELDQPSNEIIQLGASAWDTDSGLLSSFNEYYHHDKEVNWSHTLNTGCSLEELLADGFRDRWAKSAKPASEIDCFWKWAKSSSAGKKFVQWGKGDIRTLIAQSCEHPNHIRSINLKEVYRFIWQPSMRLEANSGLSTACKNMSINPPEPAHDAYADAYATAELFIRMFSDVKNIGMIRGML